MDKKIVFLAAAALAACNGGVPASPALAPIAPNAAARPGSLAFLTDYVRSEVYIFALPSMKLTATLTGFQNPAGACSDAQGHVWIANTGRPPSVVELSRAGKVLKTLSVGSPWSCAVDPATGDLAVTERFKSTILLYHHAQGTPKTYSCSGLYDPEYAGFGPGSTIMVDGQAKYGGTVVCAGSPGSLSPLTISGGTIVFPGGVQWDNARSTWVIVDTDCGGVTTCSYPLSGSGVLGSPTYYSTYNAKQVCHIAELAITGNNNDLVVGGDYHNCGGPSPTAIDMWPYPSGGKPTNYHLFKRNRRTVLSGVAISAP